MEKRDKRGLTEAEYLAQYKPGRYPQPSLTVDIILLAHAEGALRVLLVRRGGHPYLGCWALPGGFAEPQETTAQAAARELAEETHAQGLALTPIGRGGSKQPGKIGLRVEIQYGNDGSAADENIVAQMENHTPPPLP